MNNKNIYKCAVDEINADPELIRKTNEKALHGMESFPWNNYKKIATIASCCFILIAGVITYNLVITANNFGYNQKARPDNKIINDAKLSKRALAQIAKYYVPFNATQIKFSKFSLYIPTKCPSPLRPGAYDELLQSSIAVVLCTVKDTGVYRNKSEQYNPRASFGEYIYTVHVDKILRGKINYKGGDFMPILEKAWAEPSRDENDQIELNKDDEIISWRFGAFTVRAKETRNIIKEKQYVMFLSKQNYTDFLELSISGFGAFPVDFIEKEYNKNSLSDLENIYENQGSNRNPYKDDILYRICSLNVKAQFLN